MARQQKSLPSENLLHTEGQLELSGDATVAAVPADRLRSPRVSSPGRDAWRRFRHNWAAMASLAVILLLVILAAFAPFMHTINPYANDYSAISQPPTAAHWFGTDGVGGDLYSRLLYGLRIPLVVSLIGTLITVGIGTLLGMSAGYFGGAADSLISRFTDLMFAFPAFLLALITVTLFGTALNSYVGWEGSVILLTIVFALVSWPPLMRFVRSLTLSLKEQQFIEAARTCGSSDWKIMRRHLLPNMWGLILVQASFIVVFVITTETVLSVFGIGVPPPNPDLGQILYDGSQVINVTYAGVLFPSIFLTAMILAFTFLGDGVRDAVDPRMNS